jgi:hypothetical protein
MKMKTTIVLHDVYCDVTYPEYLHVRNRYYKNPTWVILRQLFQIPRFVSMKGNFVTNG